MSDGESAVFAALSFFRHCYNTNNNNKIRISKKNNHLYLCDVHHSSIYLGQTSAVLPFA